METDIEKAVPRGEGSSITEPASAEPVFIVDPAPEKTWAPSMFARRERAMEQRESSAESLWRLSVFAFCLTAGAIVLLAMSIPTRVH